MAPPTRFHAVLEVTADRGDAGTLQSLVPGLLTGAELTVAEVTTADPRFTPAVQDMFERGQLTLRLSALEVALPALPVGTFVGYDDFWRHSRTMRLHHRGEVLGTLQEHLKDDATERLLVVCARCHRPIRDCPGYPDHFSSPLVRLEDFDSLTPAEWDSLFGRAVHARELLTSYLAKRLHPDSGGAGA